MFSWKNKKGINIFWPNMVVLFRAQVENDSGQEWTKMSKVKVWPTGQVIHTCGQPDTVRSCFVYLSHKG